MKILHLCLSCFYIDNYAYQENLLVAEHVKLGHDVKVVASTETFDKNGRLTYTQPGSYLGSDGASVTRLAYKFGGSNIFSRKLRSYVGLKENLNQFKPDLVVFHGLCAFDLLVVVQYCKNNPTTILYADSHEDQHNSAKNLLSRWGLHFLLYKPVICFSIKYIRRIFCVSMETIDFVKKVYGVPESKIEFFPLGGYPVSDEEYYSIRSLVRSEMDWKDGDVVFMQTGKIDSLKRLDWTLDAFKQVSGRKFKLIIAGLLAPEIEDKLISRIRSDARINYIGWVSPNRLRDLVISADVYVQPGSQSASMQMAICCRKPVILDKAPSHIPLVDKNGFLVESHEDYIKAFIHAAQCSPEQLQVMSNRSAEIANELLDYKKQALRFLENY